jgi:hypothetical protein
MDLNSINWYNIGTAVAGFIIGVVATLISRIQKNNSISASEKNKKYITIHTSIHECLTELRIASFADRASIYQFHNGDSLKTGASLKKFSITHESTEIGIEPYILFSSDLVVANYVNLMKNVASNSFTIVKTDSLEKDSSIFRINKARGIHSFSVLPLYGTDSVSIIGFIRLDWSEESAFLVSQILENENTKNSLEKTFFDIRDRISGLLIQEAKTEPHK